MAVVRNFFNHTLSNIDMVTHNITGLTAEGSNWSTAYVNLETTLYFVKAIYQTLLDAGYADTTMDETEYSITVLGFKFYPIVRSANSPWSFACPYIYTHHRNTASIVLMNVSGADGALNANGGTELSFNIRVRGDGENVVAISLGSYAYPDNDKPLLVVAKATNLLTGEDAFLFDDAPPASGLTTYLRNKNSLYTYYETIIGTDCNTYYKAAGLNTPSKKICMPVFACYGSFLVKGILQCDTVNFSPGKYYQIGDDIYYVFGTTGYLLMKVS